MSAFMRNLMAIGGVAILAVGGTSWYFISQRPAGSPSQPAEGAMVQSPPPTSHQDAAPALAGTQAAPADLDAGQPAPSAPPAAGNQSTTAATSAAPSPATPTASVSSPDTAKPAEPEPAEPAPDVWPQGVKPVKFVSSHQAFTLIHDSAAYMAPSQAAPQMYPLPSGTQVYSIEKSTDAAWVVALTTDGKAAYLPVADLGPFDSSRPAPAILLPSVTGTARVVDTATLVVGGQTLTLSGVIGEGGISAQNLQKLINLRGGIVTCALQGQAYRCKLPDGLDVARSALFNGAAKPADDASDDYRAQADAAQAARRGIWRQ
jgi:hypothetical protein